MLTTVVALLALSLSGTAAQAPRHEGRSGALRATVVLPGEAVPTGVEMDRTAQYRWFPVADSQAKPTKFVALKGDPIAPERPGAWRLEIRRGAETIASELVVLTAVPAERVRNGWLNGYHIGRYASGRRAPKGYTPPEGYIEVTRENQHLRVSENFQLKQFLTKDQSDVWPKYLVLDLRLVDKLELVIRELGSAGIGDAKLHVMSGYRTPQYNGPGGKGRARFSRHTYGDASDVWVDADGDGTMDDLNGDGRIDVLDAQALVAVVERVETKYPELVGGVGTYKANRAHGPFVHVDVRGRPARWSKR